MPLIPNKPVPALELSVAAGGRFSLAARLTMRCTTDFVIPKNYPARGDA